VKKSHPITDLLFIAGCVLFFFFTFLGNIHLFDWDEINYAECAREMIVSKDFWHVQIDFKPFHEKPPLFIWFQVLSMKLFGINEFAARIPNAVCGFFTLFTLYFVGRRHYHRSFALLWVLTYMGSILPHFYFKSGIIDPWFNYFIFVSLYCIYRFFKSKAFRWMLGAGLFCGLAVFTKGPVAFLLLMLTLIVHQTITWYNTRSFHQSFIQYIPHFIVFTCLSFSFLAIWYAMDIWHNGPVLFYDFIQYHIRLLSTEDAGHGGFPGYHIIVLLFGCFPASFIAIYVFKNRKPFHYLVSPLAKLLFVLGIVVLIVFSLVQSKIVHYSSLCYYPITYFASITLIQTLRKKVLLSYYLRLSIFLFFLLLCVVLAFLPYMPMEPIQKLLSKDPFAQANLNAVLIWSSWATVFAVIYGLISFVLFRFSFNLKYQLLSFVGYYALSIALLHLFFWYYLPNVERISQHSAIVFFNSLRNKPVYTGVYGYKSYAHLFYAQVSNDTIFKQTNRDYILTNTHLNKPVYLVTKEPYTNALDSLGFEHYGSVNGYVFLIKDTTHKRK
jgi:4-amino-4-deoxy-L-arabinose transferase-like glycosyltransferase